MVSETDCQLKRKQTLSDMFYVQKVPFWFLSNWFAKTRTTIPHRGQFLVLDIYPDASSSSHYIPSTVRAWNNFQAVAGQVVWSNLVLIGHNPFFWPDKYLSSRIIWLQFIVKYMWTIIKILCNTANVTHKFVVKT